MSELVTFIVRFEGEGHPIECPNTITIGNLKSLITELTGVLEKRQKLCGLKYEGGNPGDDVVLSQIKLKKNQKIMLMGSREEDIAEEPDFEDTEVINDLDFKEVYTTLQNRPENLAKIQRRVDTLDITVFNPPRDGKKLLVLDIDYTLFDHRSVVEHPLQQMRPHLHEFLTAAYKNYDIIIWSATSMKWIELKMREIGVAGNPNYKICAYFDYYAMITVLHEKYGVVKTKPLGVIWGKFKNHFSSTNTIMFDDLKRNFLMNPQNGLKIIPFKNCHLTRTTDNVLLRLSKYLEILSSHSELSDFNHDKWERTLEKHGM